MIPPELIEQVRNKADIVQVVSEYVNLRKRGKNFLGLCPFHPEKDASFTVSQEKQIFHCFGCNEGGNVFAFLMKIENIGFAEAVGELGAKLGINVPLPSGPRRDRNEQEKLYQVLDLAGRFFQQCLRETEGREAREYLERRGLTAGTIDTFTLGFAPAAWDGLFKHLISRGVAPEQVERTGLALPREGKQGYYDRFRNRLIVPISDQRGRPIAFGGRALGNDEPKYLNSPDTAVYHKGETVFGLNLTKEAIKKEKSAVLVEGYFDLITPWQAGIGNIAASLGTALTINQCKLLSRYCDTVLLSFDADAAGGIAAERSVELLRSAGLRVKVAALSGGKDPDEIVRNHGLAGFRRCLDQALPYLEFKLRRLLARHDLREIEPRAKALREAAALLAKDGDQFVQQEYAKLAAPLLSVTPETVLAEVKRLRHYQGKTPNMRRVTEKPASKLAEAEKTLISLAAQKGTVAAGLKERLTLEDFRLPETRAVAELIFAADLGPLNEPAHFLLENLPDEGSKKFLSRQLLAGQALAEEQLAAVVDDCVTVLKNDRVRRRIEGLKLEIREAEQAGESVRVNELLAALNSEIS